MSFIPKIYTAEPCATGNTICISGTDANHVRNVLRIPIGGEVTICDGSGSFFSSRITQYDKDCFYALLGEKRDATSEFPFSATVYQCFPKGEKAETVVQKSVELGATEIVFVISERCISRPDSHVMNKKLIRLQKIAESAAAQSGRGIVPAVRGLISFQEACAEIARADIGFLCYEGSDVVPLKQVLTENPKSIAFLIGPEGGISEKELAVSRSAGLQIAGLGKRILRTETAALYTLSAIDYHYGG